MKHHRLKNDIFMKSMLLSSFEKQGTNLKNRVVMAPMTRSRAQDGLPTDMMVEYYSQRSEAGLIITEGTAPSPNGQGYARIPGIYNEQQVEGWKKITDAVHAKGGKIAVQLMHSGRISHPLNLPEGGEVFAPSAIVAEGTIWTDQEGAVPHPTPKEMTSDDIKQTITEFVTASQNAVKAGFDAVELHGANGYLLDQFFNPKANQRTDEYGGNMENRSRLILEIAASVSQAIGAEKVGVRISPYGINGDLGLFEGLEESYQYLATQLDQLGIGYLHMINHPAMSENFEQNIREHFSSLLILSGGYDQESAEAAIQGGKGDLVAFGRSFISNPDLVSRFEAGADLNDPDFETFYMGGVKGYLDYPVLAEV